MRKLLITMGIFAALTSQAFASPAVPMTHQLQNADGTVVNAKQWGEEDNHGWETEDGYTIVRDDVSKRWNYAVKDSTGRLVSSGYKAGGSKPASATPHLRSAPAPTGPSMTVNATAPKLTMGLLSPNSVSASPPANANLPVILINFTDRATKYSKDDFETKLFGTGNKSMRDYYEEVSYGKHLLSSGAAGIIGWVTASRTHDYYGVAPGTSHSLSGALTYEAVQKTDATVDFSDYDNDGDCKVDMVAIVHQGAGQEASGVSTDIWSHAYYLSSAQYAGYGGSGAYTTNDDCKASPGTKVKIDKYVTVPEILYGQMQSIGVLSHEYGHVLGLPDLYDTTYASAGIGKWSLMSGGTWLGTSQPGDTPAHLDAWSKYYLGWVNPTVIEGLQQALEVNQAETNAESYQLLPGNGTSGEYFLIENRQKVGFDAALPGTGLLIWHVDASKGGNYQRCYPGSSPACSASYHYKVALEQADGLYSMEKSSSSLGDAGDPYAAVVGKPVPAFTETSSPSSNYYSGAQSLVRITDISASGETMTATFDVKEPCSYTVALDPISYTQTGGTGALTVSTNRTGCTWTMPTLPSWITANATGVQSGEDNSVTLTVAPNTSLTARSQILSFAGKAFTITEGARPAIVPVMDFGTTAETTVTSSIAVNGTVSPSYPVKIYRNGTYVGLATLGAPVNGKSTWTYTATGLVPGNNTIQAQATSSDAKTTLITKTIFYDIKFIVTASATSGGTLTPSGAVTVQGGSAQSFTLTPSEGNRIAQVLIDGASVTPASTINFEKVVSNRKLAVTFAPPVAIDMAKTAGTVTASSVAAGGAVAPYCTVQVYRNGILVGTAPQVTAEDGTKIWSYTVTGLVPGNNTIGVVATSIDRKTVSASKVVVYDIDFKLNVSATSGGTASPLGTTTVKGGSSQTIAITPTDGYRTARILVNSVAVAITNSLTFSNIVREMNVAITYLPPTTIDMSSTAAVTTASSAAIGGSVADGCTVRVYRSGGLLGIATQTVGESGRTWSYNVTGLAPGTNTLSVVATSIDNKTATAYKTVTYDVDFTLTVSSNAGGTVSPAGATVVKGGTTQAVTITPSTGNRTARILVDNVSIPITTSISLKIDRSHTVSAVFLPPTAVDMTKTPATVTASSTAVGGIVTPECRVDVYRNGVYVGAAAQAVGDDGKKTWSYTVSGLVPGNNTIKAVATSLDGKVVSASASVVYDINFTITTSASSGGTISPLGSTVVKGGSSKTITITPDQGYRIAKIVFNEISVPIVSSITIPNVIRNHNIVVTFLPPVVVDTSKTPSTSATSSVAVGGTVAPGCTVYVYRNGAYLGVAPQQTAQDGSKTWSYSVTGLIKGTNTIKATAVSIDNKMITTTTYVTY